MLDTIVSHFPTVPATRMNVKLTSSESKSDEKASPRLEPVPNTIPELLVSVETLSEFQLAHELGVGWIDFKNPKAGSLGRPEERVVQEFERLIGLGWNGANAYGFAKELSSPEPLSTSQPNGPIHAHPPLPRLSMALGELKEYRQPIAGSTRFGHWKIGLSNHGADWTERVSEWLNVCSSNRQLILVYYADENLAKCPSFEAIASWSHRLGLEYILVDTWQKGGKRLTDWVSEVRLREWIELSHHLGLKISLAGSLSEEDINALVPLGPDVIAVRSVACRNGDRNGMLCPIRVQHLVDLFTKSLPLSQLAPTTVKL